MQHVRYAYLVTNIILILLLMGCGPKGINLSSEPWDPENNPARKQALLPREACSQYNLEKRALFGDLHIHTSFSMDANSRGTKTLPDDAYAFASGKPLNPETSGHIRSAQLQKIDRPLDFAAVTDHAEWLAETSLCTSPKSPAYETEGCQIYRGEDNSLLATLLNLKGFRARLAGVVNLSGRAEDVCGINDFQCRQQLKTQWTKIKESAEKWYDRSADCTFTTFHAWEYSRSPYASKVHRNVILRNEIGPELPISSLETPLEIGLRHQLMELCNDTDTGCEAIAIPHNPNLSNGQMFRIEYEKLPLEEQKAEAALRASLEPIVEMMQIKGESECRNGMYGVVGAEDELCDFEKVRDFGQPELSDCGESSEFGAQAGKGCTSRTDYVRFSLIEGLREKQRLGVNPYSFGFIGSTDNHMASPGSVSESGAPGKFTANNDQLLAINGQKRSPAFQNPGGIAGVWAEENTRDSIFNAIKRRETFATSGPRIIPRFFSSWESMENWCEDPELISKAYGSGVPMGGNLERNVLQTSPHFLVSATADPGTDEFPGGLLQEIQIIKSWLGTDDQFHYKVISVAGEKNNGASVDSATCKPIGRGEKALCGTWQDPNFDPTLDAIYYSRVVENPSCRWSAHLCLQMDPSKRPDACDSTQIPKVIQERAWTSPIWYSAN